MFKLEGERLNGNNINKSFNCDDYKVAKFEFEAGKKIAKYLVLAEVKEDRYKQLYIYYKENDPAALVELREKASNKFNRVVAAKSKANKKKKLKFDDARLKGFQWLADNLNKELKNTKFELFTEEECVEVIKLCNKILKED